jgi:hypothetical protein
MWPLFSPGSVCKSRKAGINSSVVLLEAWHLGKPKAWRTGHMAVGQLVRLPNLTTAWVWKVSHGLARIVAVAHSKLMQCPFVQWFD